MQFAIIAHDAEDVLKKRLAVRNEHIALGDEMRKNGEALFGVALLNEKSEMNGSIYIVDFPSEKKLQDWLKKEPYITGEVWEKIQIIPCKVGPSFLPQR